MLRIHALPPRPEGRGFTRVRMKYLFLALLALLVSGCSVFQQPVIQTKLVYVEPRLK